MEASRIAVVRAAAGTAFYRLRWSFDRCSLGGVGPVRAARAVVVTVAHILGWIDLLAFAVAGLLRLVGPGIFDFAAVVCAACWAGRSLWRHRAGRLVSRSRRASRRVGGRVAGSASGEE